MVKNKRVILSISALLVLVVCYLIGQFIVGPKGATSSSELGTATAAAAIWESVSFEGNQETSDNPWGITAGWFEMENEGKCILLNPNTALMLEGLDQDKEISFQYELHPWVRENSDGAGALVWVLDHEDSILYEEEISISSQDDWEEYQLDLSQYDGAEKVKVLCNNGTNEDDSGDWLVIKPFK